MPKFDKPIPRLCLESMIGEKAYRFAQNQLETCCGRMTLPNFYRAPVYVSDLAFFF